ncbi:MAG: hypothetical protein LBC35_05795 [Coriobacteriales bacterium]|jgi:hypothetical protein|nr:hypothetical protein [Coriobacteriales bacterium]
MNKHELHDTKGHRLTHKQRLAVWFGSVAGALALVAAVVIGIGLYNTSADADGIEASAALSADVQDTHTSTSGAEPTSEQQPADINDSASSGEDTQGSDTASIANGTQTAANGASTNGDGGSTGAAPQPVWHPGWEERVWVDTSFWFTQQRPIWGSVYYDGTPVGAGDGWDELIEHGGGSKWDIVGYEPVSEWISDGYWDITYHEGYWE